MNARAPHMLFTRIMRSIIAIITILLLVVSTYAWTKLDTLKGNTANAFLNIGGGEDGALSLIHI